MNIEDLSVLVVEDEDFQRKMVVRMLKTIGLQTIQEATDSNTALNIIKNNKQSFDIMICDLMMSGMDGMELIRHLGESKSETSIIISSGLDHTLINSITIMARDYGVNILGLTEKPTSIKKLEPLLKKYILKQTTVSPDKPKPVKQILITHDEIMAGLKNNEFEPFFQPKVEISSGKLKGAESLVRWRHPKHGVISPRFFIEQMESNGLIDELTWIMLQKTASWCSKWHAAGLDVTVSVNLSIKSLVEPKLAENIIKLMQKLKIKPRHIIFEVTESAIATHIGSVLENLARLRVQGFGLSIDDFGTGYSSLQQLMRIPFSELKIDRSFITNASLQESTRVIVASSLEMAKKLMITSVAEGVASEEDWNFLSMLGCDVAQGYLISKPIPADKFYDWAMEFSPISF